MMTKGCPEPLTQETMLDKGETPRNFTNPSGIEKLFFDHNTLTNDDFSVAWPENGLFHTPGGEMNQQPGQLPRSSNSRHYFSTVLRAG